MIDLKTIAKTDPIKRHVEKGLEQTENTPMEPPAAYPLGSPPADFENLRKPLQILMEEHQNALQKTEKFEQAFLQFKANGYQLDSTINTALKDFFSFLDNELFPHNSKEEKMLFPVLHQKLIETGEHGIGTNPKTAIDVMEDDHVKFIQLGTLTFNLLGLAARLKDRTSQLFVLDTAYENGRELIELLKLHIYREDHTLFPLAQRLLSCDEFESIENKMLRYR
ncbi:MAG: hemerythrin domain-containing protein [Bacteroidetes bacterium]|nr:hemerythrin domain-containing protein [Bacteroidota bacterium]MBS1541263.1 hemerythrin domain-containing protein [Bacteroidota bacterium]